jgi:hypothetical protein
MMKPNPIDGQTYALSNGVLKQARTRGLDALEELNRAGLLLTPAARKQIQVAALSALLESLGNWRPAELLRRLHGAPESKTPADMYHCILGFIEEYLTVVKSEQ